jgi:gliding motility-associated-like protein
MKKSIHIVYLLVYLISFQLQAQGQNLPLSCGGSRVRYGVSGLKNSVFEWDVKGGTFTNYNDSIDVTWDTKTTIGIITVIEHTSFTIGEKSYSCNGTPDTAIITINNPTLSLGSQISICPGQTTEISSPVSFSSYQWNTGATSPSITASEQGWYKLKGTDNGGCSVTDSIYLALLRRPITKLGNDTIICGSNLILDAGDDGLYYKWSTGEITRTIQLVDDKQGHVITVQIENDLGCITTDTIEVVPCNTTPNTMTPNGDGWNDKWKVDRFASPEYTIEIFDRWGRMVYQSTNGLPTDGWDGTSKGRALPMDSYYYIVKHKVSGKIEKGSITIIR